MASLQGIIVVTLVPECAVRAGVFSAIGFLDVTGSYRKFLLALTSGYSGLKTFASFVNILAIGMIIADASVLIALAKMRKLELLRLVYGDVLIGPEVKAESIDAGKRISAPGVERIEKALDDGWLQVARLSAREKNTARNIASKGGLDLGEAESIALASSRKLMVILDDRAARSFAEIMGVDFLGTAGMLLQGFVRKHLTLLELEDAVEALSKTIWLAPAVIAEILKKARENEE